MRSDRNYEPLSRILLRLYVRRDRNGARFLGAPRGFLEDGIANGMAIGIVNPFEYRGLR